jgi:hypothetical protein
MGYLAIGYGDPHCVDRLNTISFNVPVVGNLQSKNKAEQLVLLVDSSTTNADQPGFYMEDGQVKRDDLEDFYSFWYPLEQGLIVRSQTRISSNSGRF